MRYSLERLRYRLSRSDHAGRFILKGAMLFAVWSNRQYRATQDMDLLGAGSNSPDELVRVFRDISQVAPAPDGMTYLADSITAAVIREDLKYEGVRVRIESRLGNARIPLTVGPGPREMKKRETLGLTASYVPPPPDKLVDCLGAWEKFLHQRELPPLVQAGMMHYQFEAIHPFLDGNGRIGRLLITLFLVERGVLPTPLLYLSAFFEATRRDYYDRLSAVTARGAWGDWWSISSTASLACRRTPSGGLSG